MPCACSATDPERVLAGFVADNSAHGGRQRPLLLLAVDQIQAGLQAHAGLRIGEGVHRGLVAATVSWNAICQLAVASSSETASTSSSLNRSNWASCSGFSALFLDRMPQNTFAHDRRLGRAGSSGREAIAPGLHAAAAARKPTASRHGPHGYRTMLSTIAGRNPTQPTLLGRAENIKTGLFIASGYMCHFRLYPGMPPTGHGTLCRCIDGIKPAPPRSRLYAVFGCLIFF